MKKLLGLMGLTLCACVAGCTAAQIATFEADVTAGSKAIVTAAPLACDIADVTDPVNAQAICQVLDEAGNVVSTLPVVIEPIAALTTLVKLHPAKTPAVVASLAAAKAKLLKVTVTASVKAP